MSEATDGGPGIVDFRTAVIDDANLYAALLRAHRAIVQEEERLTCDSVLLVALGALAQRHGDWQVKRSEQRRPTAKREVECARALIEERHAEELPVNSIARSVGMSSFHLMRQFRQQLGIPIHAYQLQVRIERAKRLLAAGMPPVQVAQEVGFADQSHLTRRFKGIVGTSPACYRKDLQGQRRPFQRRKAVQR